MTRLEVMFLTLEAIPLATRINILACVLLATLFAYLIFGSKRWQALATLLMLVLFAGAFEALSENIEPDRIFMCRPDVLKFFDRTGASKVFYAKVGEQYEFFNHPGTHPQRGVDIQAVTPQIASLILASFKAGDTPSTRRECELQHLVALQRDAKGRDESGRSLGNRLLSWLGVGHSANVQSAQSLPLIPSDAGGLTTSVSTDQVPKDNLVETTEQVLPNPSNTTEGTDSDDQNKKEPEATPSYRDYLAVTSDRPITAIAVDGEHAELAREIVEKQLTEGETRIFSGRFRTDGLFERAFSGEADVLSGLHLPANVNRVVLARSNVTRTENPSLHGVVKITFAVEARTLDSASGATIDTRQFSAQGVGFSDKTAWAQLRERLTSGT